MNCTRCEGTGFINLHQIPAAELAEIENLGFGEYAAAWVLAHSEHDVQVCDCCGDGHRWYGTPGEHNDWVSSKNPRGSEPLPECM